MALLEVHDVSVRFGGLAALSEVELAVESGVVTGLIGPNGAGKTTLFNVITGLQRTNTGSVRFAGTDITTMKPHRRASLGIARTFQRLEVFGSLSVRENVLVAAEMRRHRDADRRPAQEIADALLERVELDQVADARVDTLPTGTGRIVELARALATAPRLLLLDEPSSGLNQHETEALSRLLVDLVNDDLAVLLVEHDMPFVMSTCSYIHVLDFGTVIASGPPATVQADPSVIAAYLGDDQPARVTSPPTAPHTRLGPADSPALVLRDVHAGYGNIEVLHGIDLAVGTGEVLALLGANGAGKSTLLKVLSGQITPRAGEYELFGTAVNGAGPDALARAGLCTIPEGRGIFRNLTVLENLRMLTHTGGDFGAVVERAFAQFPRLAERPRQTAGTLSGGEQQMLALARALATDPHVLLLDELSMGLAPLVVEELYEIVAAIARGGVTTVIVEQFAHGILHVADRAAIMLHGRIEEIGTPSDVAAELASVYLGDR
ncbi:MAG TPA: ATP-binding cassette domain-containing protein [Acidimicrobiia bacterium]|nr:ATP-binding cassette domain-containing protein [Acidimicrobiia bacterium]